jgi:hypothetical protein
MFHRIDRKPLVEFAGGLYHMIARGNRRAPIFHDVADLPHRLISFITTAVSQGM